MNARIQAWLDQEDARMKSVIRRHGWAIEYIGGGWCSVPDCDGGDDEGPPFEYTVGLFGLGHPELLVFGLDPETSYLVLNELGSRVRADGSLVPGQLLTFENWDHRGEVSPGGGLLESRASAETRDVPGLVPTKHLTLSRSLQGGTGVRL